MSTGAAESIEVGDSLVDLLGVSGALVAGIGNWKTGKCLAFKGLNKESFPNYKIETAITYNSEVIKAKMRAAQALQFEEAIDDIMISLPNQWHIIKLLSKDELFLYLALDRSEASISSAGLKLMQAKRNLSKVLV